MAHNNGTVVLAQVPWPEGDLKFVHCQNWATSAFYVTPASIEGAWQTGTSTSQSGWPNRRIGSGTGTAVTVSQGRGTIQGIWVYGAASGVAATVNSNGVGVFNRCLFTHSYYGLLTSFGGYASAAVDCSAYYNTIGFFGYSHSVINCAYSCAIGGTYGFMADRMGSLEAYKCVACGNTAAGFNANTGSHTYAIDAWVRNNGSATGIISQFNSTIAAHSTNGQVNCATNFNPTPTIPGYAISANDGVIYVS
jgi:hypothetical protein